MFAYIFSIINLSSKLVTLIVCICRTAYFLPSTEIIESGPIYRVTLDEIAQ